VPRDRAAAGQPMQQLLRMQQPAQQAAAAPASVAAQFSAAPAHQQDDAQQKQKRKGGEAPPTYSSQSVFAQFQQQMQAAQTNTGEGQRTFTAQELLEAKEQAEAEKRSEKPRQSAGLSVVDHAVRVAQQQQQLQDALRQPPQQVQWSNGRPGAMPSRLPLPPRPAVGLQQPGMPIGMRPPPQQLGPGMAGMVGPARGPMSQLYGVRSAAVPYG